MLSLFPSVANLITLSVIRRESILPVNIPARMHYHGGRDGSYASC